MPASSGLSAVLGLAGIGERVLPCREKDATVIGRLAGEARPLRTVEAGDPSGQKPNGRVPAAGDWGGERNL